MVTCGRCADDAAYPVSSSSRALICRMIGDQFQRGTDEECGARERKEIGRFFHHLFLHHVEGYRLPRALQLLRGVN
jgi:hypothetical protein